MLIGEVRGLRVADSETVPYPPDPVHGSSGWFTLAVREGTAPTQRLNMLMWAASTGWYYRGRAYPDGGGVRPGCRRNPTRSTWAYGSPISWLGRWLIR